jgi:hypothetical protein
VRLVEQWREIQRSLPGGWDDARLLLTVDDAARCERAAALLAPANPGRSEGRIRFYTARRGAGVGPDAITRLLRRLDDERIGGDLELVSSGEPAAGPTVATHAGVTLAAAWEEALAGLPADWSDLYIELELTSTDYLEPAALALSPVNPSRYGGKPGFRFRCAREFGYGASPEMVRRCLERLDERGIGGEVRILRALSDTKPVATQGPVWYVGGRSV